MGKTSKITSKLKRGRKATNYKIKYEELKEELEDLVASKTFDVECEVEQYKSVSADLNNQLNSTKIELEKTRLYTTFLENENKWLKVMVKLMALDADKINAIKQEDI